MLTFKTIYNKFHLKILIVKKVHVLESSKKINSLFEILKKKCFEDHGIVKVVILETRWFNIASVN